MSSFIENPLSAKTKILSYSHLEEIHTAILKIVSKDDPYGYAYKDYSPWRGDLIRCTGNYRFDIRIPLGKNLPNVEFTVDHGIVVAAVFPKIPAYYNWKFIWPFESFSMDNGEIEKNKVEVLKKLRLHRTDKFRLVSECSTSTRFGSRVGKYKGFYLDKLACRFSRYLPR